MPLDGGEKVVVFKRQNTPPPPELRLDVINGGVSYKYIESQLNDNQSPYMLNMNADDRGALTKRKGQKVHISYATGPVFAMYEYKDKLIVHAGNKLYSDQSEIYTLTPQKGVFFVFGDTLYYLNGAEYIQYDGVTAKEVEPYIPHLTIGRSPSGGGELLEEFNLLGTGFIDSFNGDGTSKDFQLSLTGLDATEVVASIDGGITWDQVEGDDFTVNRVTGVVSFVTAPAELVDNVYIKAFKTVSGLKERVLGCKYFELYGGENDTRVFIAGNNDYPNWYWYSGIYDPTYFPENSFNKIGSDSEKVTGFIKQYDTLVVFKERSIYAVNYQLEADGASFPTRPLNSYVGCDMPHTIQLINNEPVFANTYKGVHILRSSQIRDERNVQLISSNINGAIYRPGLLDESETDLIQATSCDFDKKYWLCVNDKVWVWDYEQTPYMGQDEQLAWFPYDNMSANCFIEIERKLYYGSRINGNVNTFQENYNDFGEPINGIWRSKLFNFNLPDFLKTISQIWVTTRANTYSEIKIKYFNDNGDMVDETVVPANQASSFDWDMWDWDNFTWGVARYAPTIKRKPKIKKVQYFQIEFSNNKLNENLSILSLIIQYSINRKIK